MNAAPKLKHECPAKMEIIDEQFDLPAFKN